MENREKLFLKDCGLLVIRDQCLEANVSFFQEVREVGQLSVGEGIKKKKNARFRITFFFYFRAA